MRTSKTENAKPLTAETVRPQEASTALVIHELRFSNHESRTTSVIGAWCGPAQGRYSPSASRSRSRIGQFHFPQLGPGASERRGKLLPAFLNSGPCFVPGFVTALYEL